MNVFDEDIQIYNIKAIINYIIKLTFLIIPLFIFHNNHYFL